LIHISGIEETQRMNTLQRTLMLATLVSTLAIATQAQTGYAETDLVVNKQVNGVPTLIDANGITHTAAIFEPRLRNPWGLTSSATGVFWIANAGAGVATLHNTQGTVQALSVSIPDASDPLGNGGIPTGAVFNATAASGNFKISGVNKDGAPITAPASFIFATKNGTIAAWNPNVNPVGFDPVRDAARAGKIAVTVVNHTGSAAYTGLAVATDNNGVTRLYAANLIGGVDVFNTSFEPVVPSNGAFTDTTLANGYRPFNVAAITGTGGTRIFVTYANLDDLFGQGHGFVNTFALDGSGGKRFAQRGQLNAPWAVLQVPAGLGNLGGLVWVGNFGDGRINAYDPNTGEFINKVRTPDGKAIVIDTLWALKIGNGGAGGNPNSIYFTAAPNGEQDGIFGQLDPK
jgi:uncharacterized protein (TIGR03118 family)